jgi:hypothetical protein
MPGNLLTPGAVLALWTLLVLVWMAAVRFPALVKAGVDPKTTPPGGRGVDLEGVLPAKVNWKSHNYTHLLEQPTLFYAVLVILHLSGGDSEAARGLAWAYVGLRIVHSLWQSLVNTIPVRLLLFLLSSLCLIGLTVMALSATLT